jgi:hypothetical protein
MKTKRFSTLELRVYRLSNSVRTVYFDTLEEATSFAFAQRHAHPRSRKLNGLVIDNVNGNRINVAS